jgi:hypothetical protein
MYNSDDDSDSLPSVNRANGLATDAVGPGDIGV